LDAGGWGRFRARQRGETTAFFGHPTGMHNLSRTQVGISWVLQLAAAGILLQTLFFKFTGAEESVYIFTTLGAEPWGRIGSGIVELIASALLLVPATASLGAVVALGVMAGAIFSHVAVLGIEVKGDGGLLFGLALVVFACSATVLAIRRAQLPVIGHYFELA
jgi:putative oxidoreductase